jgi:hypothetical protein
MQCGAQAEQTDDWGARLVCGWLQRQTGGPGAAFWVRRRGAARTAGPARKGAVGPQGVTAATGGWCVDSKGQGDCSRPRR